MQTLLFLALIVVILAALFAACCFIAGRLFCAILFAILAPILGESEK